MEIDGARLQRCAAEVRVPGNESSHLSIHICMHVLFVYVCIYIYIYVFMGMKACVYVIAGKH